MDATIVVQKYGGSSVADPERLAQVAERVAATVRAGHRVVVVVSAMGRTTDELIALAGRVCNAPPRRELDMLLSTGERISMALLAMALHERGVAAISFTGSQSGILTNDRHSGARIIEVRPVRIQDELERGRVVIVAGFQGMSYKREITTLGRGGSDTTAVALAAALGAAYCEICSDVDGVYTADPRVVPEARRLDAVTYDEMQELAEHGAKVLNAQAVEWAKKAGIVLYARATRGRPDLGAVPETRIVEAVGGETRERRGAVAVTGTQRLTRVRAPSDAGASLRALLDVLADEGVSLRALHAGDPDDPVQVSFVRDDLPDWPRVQARLAAACEACVVDETGAVTAVGAGVGSDGGNLRRAFAAVAGAGAKLDGLSATPLRLTAHVAREHVDAVTRALHDALVG
jgi:aspartate kinase